MNLTPLQLSIQERADKTLSLGCIIEAIDYESINDYVRFCYRVEETPTCPKFMMVDSEAWSFMDPDEGLDYKIIGHPMTYGRLCYLSEVNQEKNGFGQRSIAYITMLTEGFKKNPDMLQRTVLERNVELQEKVLLFLQSLPKGTE